MPFINVRVEFYYVEDSSKVEITDETVDSTCVMSRNEAIHRLPTVVSMIVCTARSERSVDAPVVAPF